MSEKQPKSVKSVVEGLQQLQELTGSKGNYAYRGQENAVWEVESGALRRLKETNPQAKNPTPQGKKPTPSKEDFISYHKKELLEPARMDGHGVEEGRKLSDLELLAKLQHYGAATCLIDFTRNFFVAMWFACQSHKEEVKEEDGKIFILDTSNEKIFLSLEEKDLEKEVSPILKFQTRDKITLPEKRSLWHWSPHGLNQRIMKQDSLFIFGQPKIENTPLQWIEIKNKHKNEILKELERLGVTERTLFKDLPGFAESHGHNRPLPLGYGNAEYYLRKGNEALQRGDFEGAVVDYNRVIELEPDFAEASDHRGIAKYDRVIELKPIFVEAYNNRGDAKSNLGKLDEAMADLDRAIGLDPNFAVAYNNRGNIKSSLGSHKGAIADYDKAIKLKLDDAEIYYKRGIAKSGLGNRRGAIADYDKAIKLDPNFAMAYYKRGIAKFGSGNRRGAIADYNRAIEIKPDFAEAYNNRGTAKSNLNDHRGAKADYDRAIKLKPDLAEAYNNRGNAKADSDEYGEAITDYDRAIELDPDYAEAYNNRGLAKSALGDNNQNFIKRLISRNSFFIPNRFRRRDSAIADYDKAIDLDPNFAMAYNNRGQAYASLKEKEKARQDFLKARELAEQNNDEQLVRSCNEALSKLDNENNNRS